MTPPSLDGVAKSWSAFVRAVPHTQRENIALHINGTFSVYEQKFVLITASGTHSFYYIGDTTRPTKRPSEHVSEFVRGAVKTNHGKSKLYDPLYMTGLVAIRFEFTVLDSGFETQKQAEARAKEIATVYAETYTQEFMLSNQNRGRGKDLRPRFYRKPRTIVQQLELLG